MAKMKIGPIEVERGTLVPYVNTYESPQVAEENEDGSVHVVDAPYNDRQFMRGKFRTTIAQAQQIEDFLRNGARFRAVTFTLRDPLGVSHTVRFWDKKIHTQYVGNGFARMDLLFRKETN